MLGSAVHAFLEGAARDKYSNGDDLWRNFCEGARYTDKYIDSHFEALGGVENVQGSYWDEIIALKEEAIMIGARAWHFFKPHQWTIIEVDGKPGIEVQLLLEFNSQFEGFVGYADLLAKDKDGHIWLIDYKTRVSAFTDYETEQAATQFALYQYVLNKLGVPVEGTITFQCLDKLPEAPRILKNGKISESKKQNCDWETYKDFVIRAGLDISDYLHMQEPLQSREYFRLTKNYRQLNEVERVWDEFIKVSERIYVEHVAKEIGTVNSFPMHLKGGNMGCKQCSFYDLCLEDIRGGDTDFIIETRFDIKGQEKKQESEIEIEWD